MDANTGTGNGGVDVCFRKGDDGFGAFLGISVGGEECNIVWVGKSGISIKQLNASLTIRAFGVKEE